MCLLFSPLMRDFLLKSHVRKKKICMSQKSLNLSLWMYSYIGKYPKHTHLKNVDFLRTPGNFSIPEVSIASGSPEVHPGQMIQVVVALVRSAAPDAVGGGGIRVVVLRVENAHRLSGGRPEARLMRATTANFWASK